MSSAGEAAQPSTPECSAANAAAEPAPPTEPAGAASLLPPAAPSGAEPAAAASVPPEEPAGAPVPVPPLPENADALLKEFYFEVKDVDRNNEVIRILSAFRLNGFEQLGLTFDATSDDVRTAFRKLSLLVHPDKCSHPQAKDAFEIVNAASKQLQDEDRRRELVHVLNLARDEVRKDRKKAVKNDSVVRLAAVLHVDGKEGVEAQWEKTPEFHEAWKAKARDLLAKAEWRRRKLTARLKDEEHRVEEDEAETRVKLKAMREHHKNWEATREKRIGTWRDFSQKKSKKQKVKPVGGIKPPKLKVEDEDRTFVQRSAVEQFRPAGKFTAPKPHREGD